ncbi:hypothetical protein Q7C_339 [Methylophaga frappieri]|uniref:SnoaL-like domain-containing protein n=2 Tax=Methylophaga frappieri (strain ATCC BAA-2434 / DSM 25690 / JAM7) TaxID=754477 RepID=I1YF24_METFJ|nr:hypothetical protein Q7C_339 [Methylophaga frappieri]
MYYTAYQNALSKTNSAPAPDNADQLFRNVFNNLQSADLHAAIDESYAKQFYFNDTFKTITDSASLKDYLSKTGRAVTKFEVTLEDVVQSDEDVYVRWTMTMQFKVLGKTIDSHSVGMSHLRFNEAGQIIVHQDFWDGADAFYQHLPVVGFWVRAIRNRL